MKIVILSTAYPLRGGIAHFTELLYKELSKWHSVSIITFKRQYPAFLFPGKTQMDKKGAIEKIKTEVIVDSINPINWIKVGRKIKKLEPDLIIYKYWMSFFAPCFGTITRIIKTNKKTKALVICDNVVSHEKRIGDKVLTKFFFNSVDYFITMSKSVENDLKILKPRAKHKPLLHPVYSNFGEAVEKGKAQKFLNLEAKPTFLFFGFIRKYKGVDILLKAVKILKEKMDFTLLIAGEFYDSKQKYLDLIESLKIKDNVKIFSDFIPNDEVKYYFSACDVVVLPYREATQSGIFQIANNFEKPIIVTDVGGLGEEIEHGKTGFVVEKNNPQILADVIFKYFNENKTEEFSLNVKKKKEKYSWTNFVKGIEQLVLE